MANLITLTIPNDDHIALRAFGKALEEMALAHGAEPRSLQLSSGPVCTVSMSPEQEDKLREAVKRFKETEDNPASRMRVATEQLQQAAPQMMEALRFEGEELRGPEIDTTAQQVESPSQATSVVGHGLGTCDANGTPWDERIHSASKALNADGTWRLRRKPKDMDEAEWSVFVETVKGELHTQTPVMTDEEVKTLEPVEIGEPTREEVDELIEASNKMLEPPVTPLGDDFHTDVDVVTEETVAGIPPLPVPPSTNDWKSEVTHPENGDLCSVCMKPQFSSPGGVTCENGHGGAPAYDKPVPPPVVVAPPVPEVTEWDFPRLMTFLTERHGKIDVATVNTLLAQDGLASLQELNAHPDKIGPFVARVKAHLGE